MLIKSDFVAFYLIYVISVKVLDILLMRKYWADSHSSNSSKTISNVNSLLRGGVLKVHIRRQRYLPISFAYRYGFLILVNSSIILTFIALIALFISYFLVG